MGRWAEAFDEYRRSHDTLGTADTSSAAATPPGSVATVSSVTATPALVLIMEKHSFMTLLTLPRVGRLFTPTLAQAPHRHQRR
jgi:hypothetical protein